MKKLELKKTVIYSLSLFIVGLIFYNTKDLILGAPLSVHTAVDGATISDSFLPISGNAKHASTLEINGRVIALNKDGSFSDGALLSPGYNIVEITMSDRFGKEKRKVFHLVAEPSKTVAQAINVHYQ